MPEEYVSFEEAMKLTEKSEDELKAFVQEKGLRQFRDAGEVKFRRDEFCEAAGIDPGSLAAPPAEEEDDDFLMFAEEEEESKSDTVSDTLDLAEEIDTASGTVTAEVTAAATMDVQEETSATADELEFGEEDIFADESTTDIPEGDEIGTGLAEMDDLEILEDEDSSGSAPSTGTAETADAGTALEELEGAPEDLGVAVGDETGETEEEVPLEEDVALGEVAEVEEEAEAPAKRRAPRRRRPAMATLATDAEESPIWGILAGVAAIVSLWVALTVTDQLIGKQWRDGTAIHGINSVQKLTKPIRDVILEKFGTRQE